MTKPLTLLNSVAYLHGKFLPFADAQVSIASSPILYGLAVYTVFGATWNDQRQQLYAFRLRDHYERLVRSARIMDFENFAKRFTYDQFANAMTELLTRNHVREDCLVRAAIYIDELAAGTRIHGLANDFAAYVYPLGEILKRSGIHACISSWTRTADNMIPSRAKLNGSYINASLMKNEALRNGFDEAIALDTNGHITEGTVANIFIVRGGRLHTPDTSADILEGITRSTILELAHSLGLIVTERAIDRSELYAADEAFFVGSSADVTPILAVDHRPMGNGGVGPITRRLTERYDALRRAQLPLHDDWLTAVYGQHSLSPAQVSLKP